MLGAELCHALEAFDLERDKEKEHEFIEVVNLILILTDYQGRGETLSEDKLRLVSKKGKRASNMEWLERLSEYGLVTKTQDQSYCLLKSAQDIDYFSIFELAGNKIPSTRQIEASNLPSEVKASLLMFSEKMSEMLSGHLVTEHHQEKVVR